MKLGPAVLSRRCSDLGENMPKVASAERPDVGTSRRSTSVFLLLHNVLEARPKDGRTVLASLLTALLVLQDKKYGRRNESFSTTEGGWEL
jgi:hypothetical protein